MPNKKKNLIISEREGNDENVVGVFGIVLNNS